MEQDNNILSLSFLKKFTNEDNEKMKNYLRMYLKLAPDLFAEMNSSIDSMNYDNVYSKAHSLKPLATYIGIVGLADLLIEIENISKESTNMNNLVAHVKEATELNRKAMAEIEDYLE